MVPSGHLVIIIAALILQHHSSPFGCPSCASRIDEWMTQWAGGYQSRRVQGPSSARPCHSKAMEELHVSAQIIMKSHSQQLFSAINKPKRAMLGLIYQSNIDSARSHGFDSGSNASETAQAQSTSWPIQFMTHAVILTECISV